MLKTLRKRVVRWLLTDEDELISETIRRHKQSTKNKITALSEQIDMVVKHFNKQADYINSEKLIDGIVDRIRRKQL